MPRAAPPWWFHRATALVLLLAWLSLGVQVRLLVGADGLTPARDLFSRLRAEDVGLLRYPSLFRLEGGDATLVAGCLLGMVLALLALAAQRPRLCFALSAPLYLSYLNAAPTFLSFQWDSLLIEMTVLAALLPADRQAASPALPWWLLRLLLFKLMVESGLAKWQSPLGDWQDGSAMTVYYETAPLPTALAWLAHHLPPSWHHFESAWTLFFELVVPFGLFLGHRARLLAGGIFLLFLLVDHATANYGFFTLQAAALCITLLPPAPPLAAAAPATLPAPRGMGWVAALWLGLSLQGGLSRFAGIEILPALEAAARPWHFANNYHLFGQITRERIEPEFQTTRDGERWVAHALHHKPGPPERRPSFVAPHQPRVDFRLWFYGLSYREGMPGYVQRLLQLLCHRPDRVQPLFVAPLHAAPAAVRIVFWRYHFSDPGTQDWWSRAEEARTPPLECDRVAVP